MACLRVRLFWPVDDKDDKALEACSRARLWWLARGQGFFGLSMTRLLWFVRGQGLRGLLEGNAFLACR